MKNNKVPNDKNVPGPGSYKISTPRGKQFSLGAKLDSVFKTNTRHQVPGPGTYNSTALIASKKQPFLSNVK